MIGKNAVWFDGKAAKRDPVSWFSGNLCSSETQPESRAVVNLVRQGFSPGRCSQKPELLKAILHPQFPLRAPPRLDPAAHLHPHCG